MSGQGTSLVALAAVYAVIGGHALYLWGGRRSELYYGLFGLVCGCMTGFAVTAAMIVTGRDLQENASAQSLQLVFAACATAFYLHFAHRLAMRKDRHIVIAGYLVAGLAALGHRLDVLVVREEGLGDLSWAVVRASVELLAKPTPWTDALEVLMLLQVFIAGYYHYAFPSPPDTFRPPVLPPLIIIAAGVFDVWLTYARIGLPTISEYAFLLLALAMSARFIEHSARVSAELAEHTVALERGSQRLEETKQELVRREQLAAVGELSAIVAHELRNPLSILQNTVAGLGKKGLSDSDHHMLVTVMDEETDRLERLVSDLLSYVKPLRVACRAHVLSETMEAVAGRARKLVSEGGNPIEVQVHGGATQAWVDPELLRHALDNLVDNAVHAGADRVELVARAVREGDQRRAIVEVRDSGAGMPSEIAQRASEPFFTTRASGTGLGLAIVERVVRAHGGALEISSEQARGTTVRMRLPQRPGDRLGASHAQPSVFARPELT